MHRWSVNLLMRTLALLLTLALAGQAASFGERFREIRKTASPAELYTFLYALPKGGDLHNHSGGSERPEWIFAILTDPARNGDDTFYTRARFAAAPDAIAPAKRFHNLRQYGYDLLTPEARKEYVRLTELTPEERAAWCNSLRLDASRPDRQQPACHHRIAGRKHQGLRRLASPLLGNPVRRGPRDR
jgi:adenosine deaminase CECR1